MSQRIPHPADAGFTAFMDFAGGLNPVDVVIQTWAEVGALLDTIDAEDAERPTALPRWSVRDTVAHMSGTERMLGGEPVPGTPEDVADVVADPDGIHGWNERHVQQARPWTWDEVRADFAAATVASARQLRAMPAADLEAAFPSPVGPLPYREFMRVRTFDCFTHILDIVDALGRPMRVVGEDAAVSGAFLLRPTGLGRSVAKRADAPAGSRIRFRVTVADADAVSAGRGIAAGATEGENATDRHGAPALFPSEFDVLVAERTTLANVDADAEPDATIEVDAADLLRVLTGRVDGNSVTATLGGDTALARRVLAAANTMH